MDDGACHSHYLHHQPALLPPTATRTQEAEEDVFFIFGAAERLARFLLDALYRDGEAMAAFSSQAAVEPESWQPTDHPSGAVVFGALCQVGREDENDRVSRDTGPLHPVLLHTAPTFAFSTVR